MNTAQQIRSLGHDVEKKVFVLSLSIRHVLVQAALRALTTIQKQTYPYRESYINFAEEEGFEPPVGANPLLFSRQVHSAALPLFLLFMLRQNSGRSR
jgi:hypothetical protein